MPPMKAFQWTGKRGRLALTDVPVPQVGESDVLLEVRAMGICGTEVNFKLGNFPPPVFPEAKPWKLPIVIGHEYSGIIVDVGTRVKNLRKGDRVSVNYVKSCGECSFCQ